jgi:predicted HTH transcriptional regulator
MTEEEYILDLLRIKDNDKLYHREGQTLEFKQSFNLSGLADYFKDFAAFANNKGGVLMFGITDIPRKREGLKSKALEQFEKIDPERITGYLGEVFSGHIEWKQNIIEIDGKTFGYFIIKKASVKPIIAKKDEGKVQVIKNGEIYFRYGGRTQKIQFSELEAIINNRIKQNNDQWLDLTSKINKAGPENAAILDTEKSIIEKGDAQIMVIDEVLASKLKFIKEGEFSEKQGATALKLVGDVQPAKNIEVIKRVKEHLTREYPLSAKQLASEVKRKKPEIKQNKVWAVIKEHDLKNNKDYAAFNFRNKEHEDDFINNGNVQSGTPCIYKPGTVDFIINILDQ